jgi:hypothetical protein
MLQGQHAGLSASRSQSRLQRNGERPTWQRILHEYRGSPFGRASGAFERAGTAPMWSREGDTRNLQDRVHVVYRSNLRYLSCMFVRRPPAATRPPLDRSKQSGLSAGKSFAAWELSASAIPAPTQNALRTLEWVDRQEVLVVCGRSEHLSHCPPCVSH